MDTEPRPIKPERITTPIQLLGAWLAGLLSIDACFLFAASNMDQGSWESATLTIAAIVNVPLFIGAVFLLQTRFRPELQEDSYYSSYLSQKTNEVIKVSQETALSILERKVASLEQEHHQAMQVAVSGGEGSPLSNLSIGINRYLESIDAIERKLVELGATKTSFFGGDEAPPHLKVSIAESIPLRTRRELISIASELGFQYYGVFDPAAVEFTEDVLFGAYGKERIPITV